MPVTLPQIRERLAGHVPTPISEAVERRAAVAAILRDSDSGPELLFIKRAEKSGDPWSGHMAFPGGHVEAHDASPQNTAERETHEEIGLDLPQHAKLLGVLNSSRPYSAGRGLSVTPFVYELESTPPNFDLNHEVDEVHWAPLDWIAAPESSCTYTWSLGGETRSMPGFRVSGRIVWGMTFGMVERLLEVAGPYQSSGTAE